MAASTELDLIGTTVVAVHAHPDDEALWTGGLLAQLVRRGAAVTVVTCTLGEEGEVIGETYQGLTVDHSDQLGGFRIHELNESLRILGCRGQYLGAPGKYRDSGMEGSPAHANPRAFVNSGQHAVDDLVDIFQSLSPQLVITYGPDGGYGHPDHIRAHHITHQAVEQLAAADVTFTPRILWAVTSEHYVAEGVSSISQPPAGWRMPHQKEIATVDNPDYAIILSETDLAAKVAAMKAHATQLWIADGSTSHTNPHPAHAAVTDTTLTKYVFALSNLIAQPLYLVEHYQDGTGTPRAASTPTAATTAASQPLPNAPGTVIDAAELFPR